MLRRLRVSKGHTSLFSKNPHVAILPLRRHWSQSSASDQEIEQARKWLANFDADTIPRSICDVSFSRSSGPGGQNVNKWVCMHFANWVLL